MNRPSVAALAKQCTPAAHEHPLGLPCAVAVVAAGRTSLDRRDRSGPIGMRRASTAAERRGARSARSSRGGTEV